MPGMRPGVKDAYRVRVSGGTRVPISELREPWMCGDAGHGPDGHRCFCRMAIGHMQRTPWAGHYCPCGAVWGCVPGGDLPR
jgi:hypothetical protein